MDRGSVNSSVQAARYQSTREEQVVERRVNGLVNTNCGMVEWCISVYTVRSSVVVVVGKSKEDWRCEPSAKMGRWQKATKQQGRGSETDQARHLSW